MLQFIRQPLMRRRLVMLVLPVFFIKVDVALAAALHTSILISLHLIPSGGI